MGKIVSIEDRIKKIIDWLKSDQNDLDYINYNSVFTKLKVSDKNLATYWVYLYKNLKLDNIKLLLKENGLEYSEQLDIKNLMLEKNKEIFFIWVSKNYSKIERLSYSNIMDFIKNNNPEMTPVWSNIYGELKQKGLIKWFNEIGLTFYVQDNKKDINKIKEELYIFVKEFYKTSGYTPSFSELKELGFEHVNYLVRDGWNLDWRVEDLNEFYVSKGLPKVESKSDLEISQVMSMDLDLVLNNIKNYFGNIPSLATLKSSGEFYDFERYLRVSTYKKNQTENEKYLELLKNKYGEGYIKLLNKLISIDGHWCDSIYELILFNFRHINGLVNNPHVPYKDIFKDVDNVFICDNLFENGNVCEIAGYEPTIKKHKWYWDKISIKQSICDKHNTPFIRIDAYKFINTNLDKYLDYLHYEMNKIYPNLIKPSLLQVIKSQNTMDYMISIFNFFSKSSLICMDELKKNLTKKEYRFFCNMWGGIKRFKEFYISKEYSAYKELSEFVIDFDSKTFRKVNGLTQEEKITRGINGLVRFIQKYNLKELPSSNDVEQDKDFRYINDMFRDDKYWYNISIKLEGYDLLCDKLGFQIPINRKVDGWYENKQNIIDILVHMKKINNGKWLGIRGAKKLNDKETLKLHNFIYQKLKGINVFRDNYKKELLDLNLI
jgi:hypothetical protein